MKKGLHEDHRGGKRSQSNFSVCSDSLCALCIKMKDAKHPKEEPATENRQRSPDYLTDDDLDLAEKYEKRERRWWYEDWFELMEENENDYTETTE